MPTSEAPPAVVIAAAAVEVGDQRRKQRPSARTGDECAADDRDASSSTTSPSPRRKGSRDARARERLLLLRHASTCVESGGGDCPTRHCREYGRLWSHLCECAMAADGDTSPSSSSTCDVPHCSTSMNLLAHFGSCGAGGRALLVPVPGDDGGGGGNGRKEFCDVCRPVWEDIARTERVIEAETVEEVEDDDGVVVVAAKDDRDHDDRDFLTIVRLITSRHRTERQERRKKHRQGSKKAPPSLPEFDGIFTKAEESDGPQELRVSSSSAAAPTGAVTVATSPSIGTIEDPSSAFPPVPSKPPSPESNDRTSKASAGRKTTDSKGEGEPLASKAPTPFGGRTPKMSTAVGSAVSPFVSFHPVSLKVPSSPTFGTTVVADGPTTPPSVTSGAPSDGSPAAAASLEGEEEGGTATITAASEEGIIVTDGESPSPVDDDVTSPAPTADDDDSLNCGGAVSRRSTTSSGMDLNVAYEAAERMRRLNLEVECSERGVAFVDHDTCTECLLSGEADVVRFPRLQKLVEERSAGGSDGTTAVAEPGGTSATGTNNAAGFVVNRLPNLFVPTRGAVPAAGGGTNVEKESKDSPAPAASTGMVVPAIQIPWRGFGAGGALSDPTAGNVATAERNSRRSSLFPRMLALREVAARIDEASGIGRAGGCGTSARASGGNTTSGNEAKVSAAETRRDAGEAKVDVAEDTGWTTSKEENRCPAAGAGGDDTETQRGDATETEEDGMSGIDGSGPAIAPEDDDTDSRASVTTPPAGGVVKLLPGRRNKCMDDSSSAEAANGVARTEKKMVVLPRIQKLMDDRQRARTSPCLICASPSCPRHSSAKFRKSNITMCHSCERLFDLDFVVDCVCTSADASERAGHVDHMVDLYDRSLLLLRYSMQFIDRIALELERSTETRNKVGLGSSGAGVVSGVLGVAAAATILTPAGPPLLITSLLFGGGATAVQTGTEAMNSLSEPSRLADRIIALHGVVRSILRVTSTLRDAMVLDHIRTDAYLEEEKKKRQVTVSTPGLVAGANVGQCLTLGGAEISAIGARAGATMSRVGTAAARTLRFAKFAGGALSAAVLVLEANAIQNTLQQIQAGNPCEKATTLRRIRDELKDIPSAESLDRECQTYLRVLEERLSRPKVDGDEVLQLAEDGDQALARDAAEGNFDKIADLLDASSESVGSSQPT